MFWMNLEQFELIRLRLLFIFGTFLIFFSKNVLSNEIICESKKRKLSIPGISKNRLELNEWNDF